MQQPRTSPQPGGQDDRAVWVRVSPHDTVMVRDGRSFDAGTDTRAETVMPGPSTIAGALAAAYGGEPAQVRGPVLIHRAGKRWEPYFPAPADLVHTGDEVWRLAPRAPQAHTDLAHTAVEEGRPPLLALVRPREARDADPLQAWLPASTLRDYLHGGLIDTEDPVLLGEVGAADPAPMEPETRVGLARSPERTAREGLLYSATHWRLRDDWAFAAQVVAAPAREGGPEGPVRFGGRGRLADVEVQDGLDWPPPPEQYPGGRVLVYTATPGIWESGWLPQLPGGAVLKAAAIGDGCSSSEGIR